MLLHLHLRRFLAEYLPNERRASPHTILAYGDTFRLLTEFLRRKTGRSEEELTLADLNALVVVEFMENLEIERGNGACSQNARLTAIRSFFRMLALDGVCAPGCAVLQIRGKPAERRIVQQLSEAEIEAILSAPDRSQWSGRRDHALLLLMYNTGARVSEIISLRRDQVRLDGACIVRLRDSRQGERIVPLWLRTIQTLKRWFAELERTGVETAFPSTRGGRLSNDGVSYLLERAVREAMRTCPSLGARRVTPHLIRHTAAIHFLRSGIEPELVARWLGRRSGKAIRAYRREVQEETAMRAQAVSV